jgi:predicted dehydrogenase
MSRRAREAEEAFEAAERADRILMEAFMYRFNPQTERLRELVDEGAIGDLRVIRACFSYAMYDTENIRLRTDVEGGSLMDVGCYCVNGSRLLGGEPELVYGQQLIGPTGTDWVFTGTMRFPGDVFALFDCGTALANRDELEAIGTEGSLFLDDPWHVDEPGIELRRNGKVERIDLPYENSYGLELENLSDAIRGEAEPVLGREDAVANARVIEALFESAESGEAVRP